MWCLKQGTVYLHHYGFNVEVDEYPYPIKSGRYSPCPVAPVVRSISGKKSIYVYDNKVYKCGPGNDLEVEIKNYEKLGQNKHFLEFYGVEDTTDGACLILEWLENAHTLEDLFQHRHLRQQVDFEEFETQLTSAIKYLHSRGICHGDLYSGNMLWDYNQERVVVIDLQSEEHTEECFDQDIRELNAILRTLNKFL